MFAPNRRLTFLGLGRDCDLDHRNGNTGILHLCSRSPQWQPGAWGYYAWRCRHPFPTEHQFPEVAVILPLRGADPSLESCLTGVLAQDYPTYQLHIVIDSTADPAEVLVVARVCWRASIRQGQSVHVSVRQDLSEGCSLKLSAQLASGCHAKLDDSIAVVALSGCRRRALRQLVARHGAASFADPRVGATTGIRWSAPMDPGLGTHTRYVFNALSFPQMFIYQIPWGGSLVDAQECPPSGRPPRVLEPLLLRGYQRVWSAEGHRPAPRVCAGGATQINSEPTDLPRAQYIMLRQLICVRLHHVFWLRMLAVNSATVLSFLICCLLALFGVVGVVVSQLGIATELWKLTGFAIIPALYFVGVMAALAVSDLLVRRVVAAPPHRP